MQDVEYKIKKRKVGRPKKRGRKKKRKYFSRKIKIDGRTCSKYKRTIDYKIVICHNGKQYKYIGAYKELDEAYKVYNDIIDNNKSVILKKEVQNNGRLINSMDEILLLEKNRDGNKKDSYLRNIYGKLVKQESNSKNWVIIDKSTVFIEETFWVWGYDPVTERKTFPWIFDNIILDGIDTKFDLKRVMLYKNKIAIKDDNQNYDIIFCKYSGDAIRFYNKIEEWVKEKKIKNIYFLGQYNDISEKRRNLENDLMKITGFSKIKIQMPTTKFCYK